MSVTITQKDFHLTEIFQESKLENLQTKYSYHAFGLKSAEDNPPVMILYNPDDLNRKFYNTLEALKSFFKQNGLVVKVIEDYEQSKIRIGLRRDVRNIHDEDGLPVFAASILSTIVYALEGRVDMEQMKKYKLPKFPVIPEMPVEVATVQPATAPQPASRRPRRGAQIETT